MLNQKIDTFIWKSTVKKEAIDLQGIVNHAHYFDYFHEARARHLLIYGIDWKVWHKNGFDFVVYHVDVTFLSSLRLGDTFKVSSCFKKTSRLKITFNQTVRCMQDDKIVAKAINTLVCVCRKTNRPVWPDELDVLV